MKHTFYFTRQLNVNTEMTYKTTVETRYPAGNHFSCTEAATKAAHKLARDVGIDTALQWELAHYETAA